MQLKNNTITTLLLTIALSSVAVAQKKESPAQTAANLSGPSATSAAAIPNHGPSSAISDYVIGRDDVLSISVWKEPDISRQVPVRPDGKISLPLAGEVQASGLTPKEVQDEISQRLKAYITDPNVTVIVTDVRSQKFNVVGQVQHPGSFPIAGPMTVLDALALGGGFTEFAKTSKIYVLRSNGGNSAARMPFNYKQIVKGSKKAHNFDLKAGDTIVVP